MDRPRKKSAATPSLPVHAFTFKQWQENASLQIKLQAVLDDPVLRLAFQTLLLAAMPNASPVTQLIPGISADAMALSDSNRYHHRSGMSHMYRALHALARPKSAIKRGAEFGELLPEDE